ncbi:MAG: DUF2017 family protein [Planctomycetota bacterium]|nr:DUF2017 family protein [Planctomycetota bacterium]
MLSAQRNDDGSYQLSGHPAILRSLWTIPGVLRKIIENPDSNQKAAARLFPPAYSDPDAQKEHRRLLEDDIQKRQLQKLAIFEKVLAASDTGMSTLDIPEKDFDAVLAVLTDLRIVLATDLGIESDDWEDDLDEEQMEDPRLQILQILGAIQHLLLETTGLVDFEIDPDDLKE